MNNNFTLASRKRRIAAFLIDHFAMTFLILAVTFLALGPDFLNQPDFTKMTAVMLATMLLGFFLYFAKDTIKGISIGKWIMGIMVRDEANNNEVPSFGRLLFRNLLIIIWPVEFIVLTTSADKKRLGDKVAKTVVLKNLNKPNKTPRILALAAISIIIILFMVFFAGSAMKNSDAYKVAVAHIEQNEAILNETGGIKDYGIMPFGNINVRNGYGEAQLEIKVIGNNKDLNVSTYLTKVPNEDWELIGLNKTN